MKGVAQIPARADFRDSAVTAARRDLQASHRFVVRIAAVVAARDWAMAGKLGVRLVVDLFVAGDSRPRPTKTSSAVTTHPNAVGDFTPQAYARNHRSARLSDQVRKRAFAALSPRLQASGDRWLFTTTRRSRVSGIATEWHVVQVSGPDLDSVGGR